MRRLGLLALCVAAACGERAPDRLLRAGGRAEFKQGLVLCVRDDDTVRFVKRFDGTVASIRRAAVTRASPQYLLATTKEPGLDQGKVIVLDEDGSVAADYRVSGASPFRVHPRMARFEGETLRQLQAPLPDQLAPLVHDGRRLLALLTQDRYAPSSFVVLEAVTPYRFEERLVFWNRGHIQYLIDADPYLVVVGFNNAMLREDEEGYPLFVATFYLDDVLGERPGADPVRGCSPAPDAPRVAAGAPYRLYLAFATDQRLSSWAGARIRDGVLHASVTTGLTYRIDVTSGEVRAEADQAYRADHLRRRREDPELPPLDSHLARLVRDVRVWRRSP